LSRITLNSIYLSAQQTKQYLSPSKISNRIYHFFFSFFGSTPLYALGNYSLGNLRPTVDNIYTDIQFNTNIVQSICNELVEKIAGEIIKVVTEQRQRLERACRLEGFSQRDQTLGPNAIRFDS
jgi:hypothetical protein